MSCTCEDRVEFRHAYTKRELARVCDVAATRVGTIETALSDMHPRIIREDEQRARELLRSAQVAMIEAGRALFAGIPEGKKCECASCAEKSKT